MPPRAARLVPLVVWSAGAAFVASLAYFAWSYLVRFDRLGPGRGAWAFVEDAALFAAFAVHHSVLARLRFKEKLASIVSPALERPLFVWTASVLFFLVCREWRPVGTVLYWHTGTAALLHRAIQLLGVAVIGGAVREIGPLDLAGISPDTGQMRDDPEGSTRRSVVASGGPYAFVRHPIYLGWILALFGSPHMTGTRLSFAVISTSYLLLAMPWEERALLHVLGQPYAWYLSRVRWRLVPGVY